MELTFDADLVEWRGPAPFRYAPVPEVCLDELRAYATIATYGWGCVPVTAQIGETSWYTALFPKDGGYLVPVKQAIARAEGVDYGDTVTITLREAVR